MANIVYVRQPYPKGDGEAILRTKNLIGDEPFLVLFGDDIIDNEVSAATQLVDTFQETKSCVIATMKVDAKSVKSYGILEEKQDSGKYFSVSKMLEKPDSSETPSRNAAIGKYVLTPDIFSYLEKAPLGKD
jgi:UTP--glucose-1-phosphate uridylyltransferase